VAASEVSIVGCVEGSVGGAGGIPWSGVEEAEGAAGYTVMVENYREPGAARKMCPATGGGRGAVAVGATG
jgi:hypothetical protein